MCWLRWVLAGFLGLVVCCCGFGVIDYEVVNFVVWQV